MNAQTLFAQGNTEPRQISRLIKEANSNEEKSAIMRAYGDYRFAVYTMTKSTEDRRIAGNCYLAAQKFHCRQV